MTRASLLTPLAILAVSTPAFAQGSFFPQPQQQPQPPLFPQTQPIPQPPTQFAQTQQPTQFAQNQLPQQQPPLQNQFPPSQPNLQPQNLFPQQPVQQPLRPIIPANLSIPGEQKRPLIAQPLSSDPRFQPLPLVAPPAEPRALPPNFGNQPQQANPQFLQQPGQSVPPAMGANPAQAPTDWNPSAPNEKIALPQKEKMTRIDGRSIIARKYQSTWQLWTGSSMFREFGTNQTDVEEAAKLLRELRPTEWVTIGGNHPTLEYGLTSGRPHLPTFAPRQTTPIDLSTVRVDNIRGVWCLRDDNAILVNFGREKADADQALAVVLKYGFNRLGQIGNPAQMSVLFAQPGYSAARVGAPPAPTGLNQLSRAAQEQMLTRTGIEVPGAGFVGERIVIDAKKLEIRKDQGEFVLVHGADVLAKFGMSEWSARDGLKVLQEMRVTEFCRFNSEITFFLVNGQPPGRVPFSVQGSRFDPERLSIKQATAGRFGLYDTNGRVVYTVASKEEADSLVKLLQHYHFDQQCQMGLSGRNGLKFLARVGR